MRDPGEVYSTLTQLGHSSADRLLAEALSSVPHGVHWSLERPRALLRAVGDPHVGYPTLHVGGTNGKGSVAAIWTSVLRAHGLRVGLYTSPHLCSFRERIQVDGVPIHTEAVERGVRDLRSTIDRMRPSFFEVSTVLAFQHFAREAVDVAVIEVGLGGRLDATNVIRPVLSAVTNVAMDHAEYLGDSLESIAGEKAGIIKEGVPFLTGERSPELLEILRSVAIQREAPFHCFDPSRELRDLEVSHRGTSFAMTTDPWGELRLHVPLAGSHQGGNAGLAVRALALLPDALKPGREAVVSGVAGVRWPGRVQIHESGELTWVLDVAHNTAGMLALSETLPLLGLPRPWVLVTGILGDKDWRRMLPPLLGLVESAVLTQPPSAPSERRWNPYQVTSAAPRGVHVEIREDFQEALGRAKELGKGGTVVVTGSCHTVGDALLALGIEPFVQEVGLPADKVSA